MPLGSSEKLSLPTLANLWEFMPRQGMCVAPINYHWTGQGFTVSIGHPWIYLLAGTWSDWEALSLNSDVKFIVSFVGKIQLTLARQFLFAIVLSTEELVLNAEWWDSRFLSITNLAISSFRVTGPRTWCCLSLHPGSFPGNYCFCSGVL